MLENNRPNFYSNWDDVHCMECCLRSVIDHFEPNNQLDWADIESITNKIPEKWSWPQFGVKNMLLRGYEVVRVSKTTAEDILTKGVKQYLIDVQGEEAARITIESSPSIKSIGEAIKEMSKNDHAQHVAKIPDIEDVKKMLDQGYLVTSIINCKALNHKKGYAGHSVLVFSVDDKYVYFHDSDTVDRPNRKETIDFFVQCATNPSADNWYIMGFKKRAG